jgi:hypothetical protein
MPTLLYFDCFSGISGDMILGALIDAGLPLEELGRALGSLAIAGYRLDAERVSRAGIAATKFRLHEEAGGRGGGRFNSHHHEHPADPHGHPQPSGTHHAHPQRTLAEINELIDGSSLPERGRTRARALFSRLAEVEAGIHQMPVERVHLHEVGALDSIIDIVGSVFALDWFGADRVVASPLNVGGGMVQSAHGLFPVPAPATVRLLEGVPVYSRGPEGELVTPTGALLVTAYADSFGPIPPMTIRKAGYGAGDRDSPGVPNVLRVLVGDASDTGGTERILVIECEIDDMNPQIFSVLMERLYAAGALEVFYAPIQMKKSRPGTLVTILGHPADREALSAIVFRETTTIGLRYQEVDRERLDRESIVVETPLGAVRFKVARRRGEVVNAAPEFDDCARVAAERGLSVKEVQAVAVRAYLDARRP